MRLVIDAEGTRHEVALAQTAEDATLADLIASSVGLTVPADQEWWVDDAKHAGGDRVADVTLLEGSRVARTPLERPELVRGWSVSLSGGLEAGETVEVPRSRPVVLGRSPQADITVDSPSVSWTHVTIELETSRPRPDPDDGETTRGSRPGTKGGTKGGSKSGDKQDDEAEEAERRPAAKAKQGIRIKDAGSTNGTLVDGKKVPAEGVLATRECVIVAGGAVFTAHPGNAEQQAPPPGSLHNLTPAGTAPFNRPPRPGRTDQPDQIEPPQRHEPSAVSKFSMATVVAPLGLAVVMVMMMGSMQYAMLALMSPALAVGTWWEGKRKRKSEVADEAKRWTKVMATFEDDIDAAGAQARARRREDVPDPATALRRAALPSTRLWQRRPGTEDFLSLHIGVGDVPWTPPVDTQRGGRPDDEVRDVIDTSTLKAAPVIAELTDAGVVGIVGPRDGALAVARSLLCQAAVHCGPADLTVGIFCDKGRDDAWGWATWLPHVRRLGDGSGGQWVSADRSTSEAMLRTLRDNIDEHPTRGVLLVIDSDVLTEGRDAPARQLLGRNRNLSSAAEQRGPLPRVSGIVLAATEEALPASCSVVVTVGEDAAGTAHEPGDMSTVDDVVLAGIDQETATRCAMDLARFDDPELKVPGASLPSLVRLPPLLGLHELSAEEIAKSWQSSKRILAPVGIGEDGPFTLDLVRDGPHGLVGGTTGSGKSEFLRSLVASLAARNDPTRLTFILIDFKGGAAFAACERLPHTIGTVSNLDEQLADRALRALEAEMRYRQKKFAAAGKDVDNLDAYLATNPAEPMPRLLLVVDEFAMLAKEYPDVLSSLVSVAAVGRTLGVHMILATQRPAGVVNEDILANTNLRVALRVQSRDDSVNVIEKPIAASIGRTQWGRAYVKLGQDDISPVQTALVTGQAEAQSSTLVDVSEVHFGRVVEKEKTGVDKDAPTDLDLLIDAIVEANDARGYGPPRPVWPEPLGERLDLAATEGAEAPVGGIRDGIVEIALADDPDGQRQIPVGWDMERGNLMLLGIPGSGTSTTLSTIALTLAAKYSPEELDLLVLDMGSRDLAPLAALPHTAAYVASGQGAREQQVRLLKYLRAELDRRRANPGGHRRTVLLLDGLAALKEEYDDFEGLQYLEGLYRAYADGPDVGIYTAVATTRAKAVPSAMDEVTTQKWLFRLADPYDYSTAQVPAKMAPPPVAGRCVVAEVKLQAHVATPSMSPEEAVAKVSAPWGQLDPKPTVVGQLPDFVTLPDLGVTAELAGEPWRIPVGVRESNLEPAFLECYENEHMLVAGPARSGKSTLLLAIREALLEGARSDGQDLAVWGIAGRRSPLHTAGLDKCVGEDGIAALVASARVHRGRLVVMVDDAEQFADADQSLAGLIGANLPNLHLVAAGRADDLRQLYGHWTTTVRKSRCGVLLQPNIDYDGELLGPPLPRRAPSAMTTARGYLSMGGGVEFCQFVAPAGFTKQA